MKINNFLKTEPQLKSSHNGKGKIRDWGMFGPQDFKSNLQFIMYGEMDPGTTIGYHDHGNDEEIYIILEGKGTYTANEEKREVTAGDVILNKPGGSHGLENLSDNMIKLIVFKVVV